MTSDAWLTEVRTLVLSELENVDARASDEKTATFAVSRRGVVVHFRGDRVLLAPSVSAGNSIASRLESKVQHLNIETYTVDGRSIVAAADSIIGHLDER